MIVIKDLKKKYGSTIAVDIGNLTIGKAEIFGLVGNNGAGKTTLLRLLLDLIKPEMGQVLSKGKKVYQSEHWKKYTGAFIDNNFLVDFLTPEEYFKFIAFVYGVDSNILDKRLEVFGPFMNGEIIGKNKYIRNLSSGDKQKVGIIGAIISKPEILILDEPFNFLDPSSQINLRLILNKYLAEGSCTIIISSHNLEHISELCTRLAVMEAGKIIKDYMNASDTMREINSYFETQVKRE